MRKMLVIIVILLLIFVGMIVYKKVAVAKSSDIKANEVIQVEEAISKVYLWEEVTNEALPKFSDINNAEDKWIWEAVKNNLENYELEYDEIQIKAKELFGQKFNKEFPKEGNQSFSYSEEMQKYVAEEIETDQKEDDFLLDKIIKTKEGYEAEILEYIADYTEENIIIVRNTNDEELSRISASEDESAIQNVVKNKKDKCTRKKVTLKKENENLIIEKVES